MESRLCDSMRLIYFKDICSRMIYVEDIYQYTVVVFTADSVKGWDTVVTRCSGGDTRKLYLGSHLQYIYKNDRMSKIYTNSACIL
jgi:hypothetical protein